MGKIFSPGKLLLTAEYAVLDGALALAVPTRPGQEFFFEEAENSQDEIFWQAEVLSKPWLSVRINYKSWRILETNLPKNAEFVLRLLQNVASLKPEIFQKGTAYNIKTNLQFPSNFGLGSSSTLISNVADWAGCDAFLLNEISLGGSGYDVAVAQKKSAILYQNTPEGRKIDSIDYSPAFADQLLFIHLNQKQDSRDGINLYRGKRKSPHFIQGITDITQEVLKAENLQDFEGLMKLHEKEVATFIGMPAVAETLFPDYGGVVKSLGAWGGDFILATKNGDSETYFREKGFDNIFSWKDLII